MLSILHANAELLIITGSVNAGLFDTHMYYVAFLILIIFLLLCQLYILTNKHHKIHWERHEFSARQTPIYSSIIQKQNEQIDSLRQSLDADNKRIGRLERKNKNLIDAIFSRGIAAEKIALVKAVDSAQDKSAVKYRLTDDESKDLLERIKICSDGNTEIIGDANCTSDVIATDALTDDELVLFHLQNLGIDNADIAALMGVSAGTLRQRRHRLSAKLTHKSLSDGSLQSSVG
jgi:hypothetical protein